MADDFSTYRAELDSPPGDAVSITPNDSTDLTNPIRGFILGAAGAVKVTMISGNAVTFPALLAGAEYALRVKRVWATGTTATGIVGLI